MPWFITNNRAESKCLWVFIPRWSIYSNFCISEPWTINEVGVKRVYEDVDWKEWCESGPLDLTWLLYTGTYSSCSDPSKAYKITSQLKIPTWSEERVSGTHPSWGVTGSWWLLWSEESLFFSWRMGYMGVWRVATTVLPMSQWMTLYLELRRPNLTQ